MIGLCTHLSNRRNVPIIIIKHLVRLLQRIIQKLVLRLPFRPRTEGVLPTFPIPLSEQILRRQGRRYDDQQYECRCYSRILPTREIHRGVGGAEDK